MWHVKFVDLFDIFDITKSDKAILLQSELGITKSDRLLLQSVSGIVKRDKLYYKVRLVLQSVTVITK